VSGPFGDLDVITVTGVRARGRHGVFERERRDGQQFVVDVALGVDTAPAADHDDLARTVDYATLAERVAAAIGSDPVHLIETLAARIAAVALALDGVRAVTVTVHKPQAPMTVPFDDVAVTITRWA